MAAKNTYPSDDEIVEGVVRLGSVSAVARNLGFAERRLREHVRSQPGLRERCDEATRRAPEVVELPERVSREEMLEQENRDLRRKLNAARSEDVKFERVLASIERHLPVTRPSYKPSNVRTLRKSKTAHTLVLLWSDQHAAEIVSREQTNGLNEYDWNIMLRRHDELRRGIASWAEMFGPIERLVVLSLGDGLSGNIHEELAETNAMPLSEAAVQWGVDGAEWLRSLPDVIPWQKNADVLVACVPGNHPRAHKKPRAKSKHDNGDWVSSHIMRQALSREEWIRFEIPRAARHMVTVCGRRILAMHGDAVPPSAMVGVSWGGIVRLEAKLRNQFAYDHLAMGHFHEPNIVGNRRIWVNGSVKGDDEYGIERFGGGATATQLLVPFHPKWGMVGAQFIDLEPKCAALAA